MNRRSPRVVHYELLDGASIVVARFIGVSGQGCPSHVLTRNELRYYKLKCLTPIQERIRHYVL